MPSPVHKHNDLWWFYNETWSEREGPYSCKQHAEMALDDYCNIFLEGRPPIHQNNESFDGVKWSIDIPDMICLPDGRVLKRLCD